MSFDTSSILSLQLRAYGTRSLELPPLTPDEEILCARGQDLFDSTTWTELARAVVPLIIRSYKAGECDTRAALDAAHRVSIACPAKERMFLLGMTAALLRVGEEPVRRRGKPRPHPEWLRVATVSLVLAFRKGRPGRLALAPDHGKSTSPLIQDALDILESLGLFSGFSIPKHSTVYAWVRERRRQGGTARRPSQRERKSS